MRKLLLSALFGSLAFCGTASAGFTIFDATPSGGDNDGLGVDLVGVNVVSEFVTPELTLDPVAGSPNSSVAAGTFVNVDFFSAQHVQDPFDGMNNTLQFKISFTSQILGVVFFDSSLVDVFTAINSVLGTGLVSFSSISELLPSTLYAIGAGQGMETSLAGGDAISVQGNIVTVGTSYTSGTGQIDSFIVITKAPEPTSMAMFVGLIGCLGFAGWRRRVATATV